MNYIFIDRRDKKIISGLVENDNLLEYHVDSKKRETILGNIYRARVINVLKGMNAAFINIGDERNAFLPYRELHNKDSLDSGNISDYIKGGDSLLVEVKKEKTENKGAVVTSNISLAGKYMFISPYRSDISVSRKVKNQEEIDRLRELGQDLSSDGVGIELKAAAIGKGLNYLKKEYDYLLEEFLKIEKKKDFLPVPKLLYQEANTAMRMIRDLFRPGKYEIIVNDRETYGELLELNSYFRFDLKKHIKLDKKYDSDLDPLVQKALRRALKKEIELENAGSIVIEETEALVAIDVNTKGYTGSYSQEETVLNTNLQAAREIAQQIRLQNLSGIIIIDFIRMKKDSHITRVIEELKYAMMEDRNRPYIIGLTRLGLLEVTRKRETKSLSKIKLEECSECQGRGYIYK